MWDRVCDCISDIFTAALPTELLTWKPPERLYRTQSNASLASSFSSVSETPLPSAGRPVSVASVESSSVVEPQTAADEETEVGTEPSTAPEIAVIPSSPPTPKDNQTTGEVNDATSTNTPINAQGDPKSNAPDDTTGNTPSDVPGSVPSDITADASSDKNDVTDDAPSYGNTQQQVQSTVTEEPVESAPLLNDDTKHPASHDTPQHHVPTSSGKLPVVHKLAQQKEKKHKGTGSFLQRKKRGSSTSAVGKKKSNMATNNTDTGSRIDIIKKQHQKSSHLQSPDADLAKSKFNKIGTIIPVQCCRYYHIMITSACIISEYQIMCVL